MTSSPVVLPEPAARPAAAEAVGPAIAQAEQTDNAVGAAGNVGGIPVVQATEEAAHVASVVPVWHTRRPATMEAAEAPRGETLRGELQGHTRTLAAAVQVRGA